MCMLSFLQCFEKFEKRLFVGIGEISPVEVTGVAVPGILGVIQKELSTGFFTILSNHG